VSSPAIVRTFPARFSGFCPECEHRIEVGDEVRYDDGEHSTNGTKRVVHGECTSPDERPVSICQACFLAKPCDCED